jgi:hypothetical protein
VDARQRAFLGNVPEMALPRESPSSLDLTLEDAKLQATVKTYTDKLAAAVEGKTDVLGVAIAINGKIDSADVYESDALFRKFWPKLLKAAAEDAVAALQVGQTVFGAPSAREVAAWIQAPREGTAVKRTAAERFAGRFRAVQVETEGDVVLDTEDEAAGVPVHRTYLQKLREEK